MRKLIRVTCGLLLIMGFISLQEHGYAQEELVKVEFTTPIAKDVYNTETYDIGQIADGDKKTSLEFAITNTSELKSDVVTITNVSVAEISGPVQVDFTPLTSSEQVGAGEKLLLSATLQPDPEGQANNGGEETEAIPFSVQFSFEYNGSPFTFNVTGTIEAAAFASFRIEVSAPFAFPPFPQNIPHNGTYDFDLLEVDQSSLPVTELIAIDIINDGSETLNFDFGSFRKTIIDIPFGVTSFIDTFSGPLAPGATQRIFLDIQIEFLAVSGPYYVELEIAPTNGPFHIFSVVGDILISGCEIDCPGPNILVTDAQDNPIAGTYQVNPEPGNQQIITFKAASIGTETLSSLSVSESGDSRFSIGMQPTPSSVPPGASPATFTINFDASDIDINAEYTTLVTVFSNAVNHPTFNFTLKVKQIDFPMRVEVGPYPLPAPVPISPINGVYDIGDVALPPEPGLPNTHRVTLRVFNLDSEWIWLSDFNAEFIQGGDGLTWQWDDPIPPQPGSGSRVKLHTGNGQTSGVFHFDGRFLIDPAAPPGPFQLEFTYNWQPRFSSTVNSHRFRIVGFVAEQVAEINPTQTSYHFTDAPAFDIETGKSNYYYSVEIALAKRLFDSSYGNRLDANNNRRNFFASPFMQSDGLGMARYEIPVDIWDQMYGSRIFYRVLTSADASGADPLYSTEDANWSMAPSVTILGASWHGLPLNSTAVTQSSGGSVSVANFHRLNMRALSSDYGPRFVVSDPNATKFHPGLDIPFGSLPSQPVYAIANGTVARVGGSVNRIDIVHGGWRSGYIHLSNDTLVSHGESVIEGQLIGYTGSAGTSNHHLHLDSGVSGGSQVYDNILRRLAYTDNHTLSPGTDTFLGDNYTNNNMVDVANAAGDQHIGLIAFGVTTDYDKDLNYVAVTIDNNTGDPGQHFILDYNEVASQVKSTGVVTMNSGRTFRVRALTDDIYNDANLGYDFYVKPADTGVNQVAKDYFFFAWDISPFQNDYEGGPHLITIELNNAKHDNRVIFSRLIGPQIEVGNVQVSGTTITQVLTITNHDIVTGTISLLIPSLPSGWSATFSDANPMIDPDSITQVTLTLNAPAPDATLNSDVKVVAIFDRIPDLKDAVSLGLDMNVMQVVGGNEIMIADEGTMDFGYLALTTGGPEARLIRVHNGSRTLDLDIAVQPVQSGAITTGGTSSLSIPPNETGEFTVFVGTSVLGHKEAIITVSQAGVGSFSYTVIAEVVEPGTPPSTVPDFQGTIDGQNLDGLIIDYNNPIVNFTWNHAQGLSGIAQYQLVLQPTDGSGWLYSPYVPYPATSYSLETADLAYDLSYSIHIRALDGEGTLGPFVAGGSFFIASSPEIYVEQAATGDEYADGDTFTFPNTPVDDLPTSRLFNICNEGTGDLIIDNPDTLVSGVGFLQIGDPPVTPVAPGSCTTFRVRFHVANPGFYTGAVTIENNDDNEDPYDMSLEGTALPPNPPEIRVVQTATGDEYADGDTFTFPDTLVDNLPTSRLFDICNDGTGDLIIDNPDTLVSGTGFLQIGDPPTSPVEPGTCTSFRVRFHVASPGSYSGAITIENNDVNENPYDIFLEGIALPSNPPEIRVLQTATGDEYVDGSTFIFPDTPVGDLPISRLFDICNDGTGDLIIDNPDTLVSGSGFLQIGDPPLSVISPGTCTSFRVRFHVANPGNFSGSISIQNNDLDENPYEIFLSGIATN